MQKDPWARAALEGASITREAFTELARESWKTPFDRLRDAGISEEKIALVRSYSDSIGRGSYEG